MTLRKFSYQKGQRSAPPAFPCALCTQLMRDGFRYANRQGDEFCICRRCLSHIRAAIAEYDAANPGPGWQHPPRKVIVDS